MDFSIKVLFASILLNCLVTIQTTAQESSLGQRIDTVITFDPKTEKEDVTIVKYFPFSIDTVISFNTKTKEETIEITKYFPSDNLSLQFSDTVVNINNGIREETIEITKYFPSKHWIEESYDTVITFNPKTFKEIVELNKNYIFKKADTDPMLLSCTKKGMEKSDLRSCHEQSLDAYLRNAIKKEAPGFKGTIIATFIISNSGLVLDSQILSPIEKEYETVVLKTLKKMPAWHPGKFNGRNVAVRQYVTIQIP